MNRGFTVVEVLITLVIMTILLTLGTLGIQASLGNARDAERRSDIETLARGAELFYKQGGDNNPPGSYPSLTQLWNRVVWTQSGVPWATFFIGSSDAAIKAPSGDGLELLCIFKTPGRDNAIPGCTKPGHLETIRSEISPDQYGYEPIDYNGNHCYTDGACVAFNLYWIEEVSGELKIFKSKHR